MAETKQPLHHDQWSNARQEQLKAGRKRNVPMEVLNLSMMRTGTFSIQAALEILGIPTCTGVSHFTRIADTKYWIAALDAKFFNNGEKFTREQWDEILGDWGGVSDVPATCFADDYIALYPEAKVILVERDLEKWYESFNAAVITACFDPTILWLAKYDKWFMGPLEQVSRRWKTGWFRSHSADEMRERARSMYKEHYELVRSLVPKERLLEYKLGSGWEPLCTFLGKPVPDVPFPHANERDAFKDMIRQMLTRSWKNVMSGLISVPSTIFAPVTKHFSRSK